jgi:hypothetical protein
MNGEVVFEEIAVAYIIERGGTIPLPVDCLKIRMLSFFYKRGDKQFDIEAITIHPYSLFFLEREYIVAPPQRIKNKIMLETNQQFLKIAKDFYGKHKWESATEESDPVVFGLRTAFFVRIYWRKP